MSGYEVEHGIDSAKESRARTSNRPDLSSFWSMRTETFGDEPVDNPHATAMPGNISGMARMLADWLTTIMNDHMENEGLLQGMIDELDADALNSTGRKGMPESFFADLERIDKKKLKKEEACPICTEPFLSDPYPLVVRLPCHPDHKFDLECIQSWLTLKTTCPLDRKELQKKKEPPPKVEDDEEEYDDFYA